MYLQNNNNKKQLKHILPLDFDSLVSWRKTKFMRWAGYSLTFYIETKQKQ